MVLPCWFFVLHFCGLTQKNEIQSTLKPPFAFGTAFRPIVLKGGRQHRIYAAATCQRTYFQKISHTTPYGAICMPTAGSDLKSRAKVL
jgi:hypothetical protein